MMDGKALLKALMKSAGHNPNSLANALQNRSLQSQVTRFLDGRTTNPRWTTLEPVAAFFKVGVEAFFDSDIASQVARDRGLTGDRHQIDGVSAATNEPAAKAPTPIRHATTLYEQLLQIAKALEPYDLSARKAVASLLGDLATSPDTAEITAARITRLLDAPGNGHPQRSTSFRGGAHDRGTA